MLEEIKVNYWNEKLNIGLIDLKQVYLISDTPVKLIPEIVGHSLGYRIPNTNKRISLRQIKNGLKKEEKILQEFLPF